MSRATKAAKMKALSTRYKATTHKPSKPDNKRCHQTAIKRLRDSFLD